MAFASICLLITCALRIVSAIEEENNDNKIIFVILSEPNKFHETIAERKRAELISGLLSSNIEDPMVYVVPTDFPRMAGYWSFFPIVKNFAKYNNFSWLFLMDENTNVSFPRLLEVLLKYHLEEDNFVGYALRDERPTILHHFDDPSIPVFYPHLSAGMALTISLVKRIGEKWDDSRSLTFSIDAQYEFAKFLYKECGGAKLVHDPLLCITTRRPKCASWVDAVFPKCSKSISKENAYFAVKTCHKYHKDRVQVVKKTWAPDTDRLIFFSDVEDLSIPTELAGVNNVAHGHCKKTLSIIEHFRLHSLSFEKWLVIADDDTLFSVPRLLEILSCYDPSEPVALGERYGYHTAMENGYDYITGGGGMIFSVPVVNLLAFDCECPSADSPDDMILGMCLKRLGIPIVNLKYLHQGRPEDYHSDIFQSHVPVSFHKHWNVDPLHVYKTFLQVSSLDNRDEL